MNSDARENWWALRSTWAAGLTAIYATIAALSWNRTLIPDEIRPLIVARGSAVELVEFARLDIIQTPLSYLAARAWLNAFGHSDNVAKAFALVLGIATIVLFVYIAGRFTQHWRVASLLLCVIYLRVGSAPNLVRMYGLLLLLSVVALYFWDRWRLDPTPTLLTAWTATMVLLFYTLGSALLLLPGYALATWLYGPRSWSRQLAFAGAATASVLALAPWLAYVYPVFAGRGISANIQAIQGRPTAVLGRLPFYVLSGFDAGGGSPPLPMHSEALIQPAKWAAILLHVLLVAAALSLISGRSKSKGAGQNDLMSSIGIMMSICIGPVVVLYAFSMLFIQVLHPRYLTVLFPVYCLLLALLGRAGGRPGRFVLTGLILPWLVVISGATLVQHVSRVSLEAGTSLVANERAATDIVLCNRHMPVGFQVLWDWTRRLQRADRVHVLSSPTHPWVEMHFPGTPLDDLNLDGVNRVWFFHEDWRPHGLVSAYLADRGYDRREIVDDWYHLTLFERRR